MASRAELTRAATAVFKGQGWLLEQGLLPPVIDEIEKQGPADGAALAAVISGDYLDRHGISRAQMATVLGQALGGRSLDSEPAKQSTTVIYDNRNSIQINNSQVSGSQLNTGQQIQVNADASRDDIRTAIAALVSAGLAGDWNPQAAQALGEVIEAREDIDFAEIRDVAQKAGAPQQADPGKIKAFLTQVGTSVASSTLTQAIIAGVGAAL